MTSGHNQPLPQFLNNQSENLHYCFPTNAHTKASLGCNSKPSISPTICLFGSYADCIPLDSVPLKQHNIHDQLDHPYFSVPFCENFKERRAWKKVFGACIMVVLLISSMFSGF